MFEDPFAIQLTSATWRTICNNQLLHWLVCKKIFGALAPVKGEVLGRSRYAEDQLEKAIATGVRQYVLIGAGLDSFALRRSDLATLVKVYELDHPESQKSKRQRLAMLNIDLPKNLEFVPIDLEEETVPDALARSSYSSAQPVFFSWLGTSPYLTRDAIFDTLRSIASSALPGSEIVFDYQIPDECVDPSEIQVVKKLRKFTARRGELLKTCFDPGTLPDEICNLGFELVENLSPEGQKARYFAGRSDDLQPLANFYFAHFRVRR